MLLITIIVACPSLSSATLMYDVNSSYSLEGLGSFTGSASYSYSDSSHATFTVALTNTSPSANEGYITAMAFLLPSMTYQTKIYSVFMSSSPDEFHLLYQPKTSPFDNHPFHLDFDFGAAVGKSWEGGGKPSEGIGVGSTETFTFAMTGKGLDLLSIDDFTQQYGGQNVFAALRFKGFEDGGSDKVLGELGGGGAQVPEPATLLLFGSGILCYSLLKRRSAISFRTRV